MGYELYDLGTGSSAYITSKIVRVQDVKSRFYLNGKYLCVGICSRGFGGYGNMYRAYVKKVV